MQGKRNPRATDPSIDNVKSPHYLVLISENFIEARAALSRAGMTNLAPNQSPVKLDATSVPPVSGPPSTSLPSGLSHLQLIFFLSAFPRSGYLLLLD